jgi:hypothetical protein
VTKFQTLKAEAEAKAKQKMNQALKAPGFGFPENKAVSAIRNGPLNRTENPVHIKYL